MKGRNLFSLYSFGTSFLVFAIFSCGDSYDNAKALKQAAISLNIGYETYQASDSINRLLYKVRNNNYNKDDINQINILSNSLALKTEKNIHLLDLEKKHHKAISLFESTIEYLKSGYFS